MSLIQWPFKRKSYDGIVNPRFVSDIQAANESLMDAITAITGLTGSGFAIISGLDFVAGVPNTYTPGIFWFDGTFYYMGAGFDEGNYLSPSPNDIMPTLFQNGDTHPIYTVQNAVTSPTSPGNTPEFSGNMNQYRINLTYVQIAVKALQVIAAGLGNAATKNVGTTAGTVAAGDDARLVYTQSQFNTLFAGKSPTFKGKIDMEYDIDGTFLTNFDGTGLGIVAPFIGRALFNGNNGLPDATGSMFVGVGSGFVSKFAGGSNTYQILATDLPVLATDVDFEGGSGGSGMVQMYQSGSINRNLISIPVNSGSPNNPISLLSKYIPVFFIGQIVS